MRDMLPPYRTAAYLLLLCAICCAQDKPSAISLPDRMGFRVTPENKISTKTSKPGAKVKMSLLEAEKLDDGTLIPAGARIEGHVVEAKAYSSSTQAVLLIVLESISWKQHSAVLRAYVIGQGKLKLKDDVRYHAICDTRLSSAMEQAACRYYQGNQEARTYVNMPVLEEVRLHQPTPQSYPELVSDKHDIVLQPRMALLAQNITSLPR